MRFLYQSVWNIKILADTPFIHLFSLELKAMIDFYPDLCAVTGNFRSHERSEAASAPPNDGRLSARDAGVRDNKLEKRNDAVVCQDINSFVMTRAQPVGRTSVPVRG